MFSRNITQHAIDTIRVMPSQPCVDETEIGMHKYQSFFYAEMAKRAGKCTTQDENYAEVPND